MSVCDRVILYIGVMIMEDKPRYSRISDILDLLILMQSKVLGVTLADIQKHFNISRRTAERMRDSVLAVLPQVNEIETNSREKHWGFTSNHIKEIVNFSNEEVANLENLQKYIQADSFQDKEKMLEKTISKIKTLQRKNNYISANTIEMLLQTEGFAVKQAPKYKINLQFLEIIREALSKNKKIIARYNDRERLLCPYGLIYGDKLYLICVDEKHGTEPYCYLMHKFTNIKLTEETFDKGDFDLDKYSKKSFGVYQGEIYNVKLLFKKEAEEDVLNYNFHPTQKVKQNQDGTITVTFKASGNKEIIWHLFKWGNLVKILAPASLRKEYEDYLKDVLKNIMPN